MDTSLNSFYATSEWRAVRDRVKRRDRNRCTVSRLFGGECGGRIHVHHIQALSEHPELALDEDNLACVCDRHHPTWERLRRELTGEPELPPCRHRGGHRYRIGRVACENERRKQIGLEPVAYVPEYADAA